MEIIFTEHALFQMKRRNISKEEIITIINKKLNENIKTQDSKTIFQDKYFDNNTQKEMLLRIIGKETEKGFIVVTAYKTSKIEKYLKGGKI